MDESKWRWVTSDESARAVLFLVGLGFGEYAWQFHKGQAEASAALALSASLIVLSAMYERFSGNFSIGPGGLSGSLDPFRRKARRDHRVNTQAGDVASVVVTDLLKDGIGKPDRDRQVDVYESVVSEFVQLNQLVLNFFGAEGWTNSIDLRRETAKAVRGVEPDFVLTRDREVRFLEVMLSRSSPSVYFAESLSAGFDALKMWALTLNVGVSAAFVYQGPPLNSFVAQLLLSRNVLVYQVDDDGAISRLVNE